MRDPRENVPPQQAFLTTHWSAVWCAADSSAPGAERALETLCRTYWYPLYAFVRRQGANADDAQDSTQSFLVWLIERKQLRVADAERGKFRSFLLNRLKSFLSDERKKARAQKRGGGQEIFSLNTESAEDRYVLEPATGLTPERIFERRWALMLMERTVARLREEYASAGGLELFERLRHFHSGEEDGDESYAAIAGEMGLTVSAIKSAIYRLRQRHRALLREEVFLTVSAPGEVDDEIRYLISVLGG